MRDVGLESLRDLLRDMPVMAQVDPLSLAFLPKEVLVFEEAWELLGQLDSPEPGPTTPMLCTEVRVELCERLPAIRCTHDPLTTDLNRVLLPRYSFIRERMLRQSQVADEVLKNIAGDTVVLFLVDGLSYADLKRYSPQWLGKVTPVLVDGVSRTDQGMLRLVGDPPLVLRLFDKGLRRALGFTYWERAREPLTDRVFAGFGDQVHKVRTFDEVLSALEGVDVRGAFIQIVRSGLDDYAHHRREAPNVGVTVSNILADFERLARLLARKGTPASLHLVSDHGMLWVSEHELRVRHSSYCNHPRHYEHPQCSEDVLNVEFGGKDFALLAYPYLCRELRAGEWGVHGGLSFEESIVPWVRHNVSDGGTP